MTYVKRAMAWSALLVLAGCGGNGTDGTKAFTGDGRLGAEREAAVKTATEKLTKGASAKVTVGVNELGWRLLKAAAKGGDTIAVSPLGAAQAAAMLYNGAEGETAKQLGGLLGLGKLKLEQANQGFADLQTVAQGNDEKAQSTLANAVWFSSSTAVKQEYRDRLATVFRAKIENADFANEETAGAINAWAKEATAGLIPTVVEKTSPDFVAQLVNAVLFRGEWKNQFSAEFTKSGTFAAKGGPKELPFMSQKSSYLYAEGARTQMVRLAMGRGRYAFDIVLPPAQVPLDAWLEKASTKSLDELLRKQLLSEVDLMLPKFKVESAVNLWNALELKGPSDLSGIAPDFKSLPTATQRVALEVNEMGVQAGAVTEIGTPGSEPGELKKFHANRPFYFQIRDTETNLVIIAGIFAG